MNDVSRAIRDSLLTLSLATAGCAPPDARGGFDFERMRHQLRHDPYEAEDSLPGRSVMREPPAGTVAWGTTSATGARAGRRGEEFVERVPLPDDPSRIARGKDRYDIYCRVCHGAAGYGGSLVAANLVPTRAFSLRTDAMRGRPAGYVYAVIREGTGRMPAMAWQLSADDRWAVVAYLQMLLETPAADSAALADSALAAELSAIDARWLERQARQKAQLDSIGRMRER